MCVCVLFVLTREFICRSTFIWESTEHVTMNKIFEVGVSRVGVYFYFSRLRLRVRSLRITLLAIG